MCDSFKWHSSVDMLAAAADLRIHSFYYPAAIYVDKELMSLCKMTRESTEIGRESIIEAFTSNSIIIKKKNGSNITISTSPYPKMLLHYCGENEWQKAIKLCRYIKERSLWAFLAAISLQNRKIETAEIALANIESIEKVNYILKLNDVPSISRQAGLLVYFKKYSKILTT